MMNPITALINIFWDSNDRSLSRQEIARSNRQEAKLEHFAQTGETTPPQERVATLNRGADASSTAWVTELLYKYQLRIDTAIDGRTAVLVDRKYPGLVNNTVKVDLEKLLTGDYLEWKATLRAAHYAIRGRAKRAGLQKPYPRPGNPGKGVSAA